MTSYTVRAETSTNLSTDVASTDYVFNHPEADTMLFSAYAKLRDGDYNGTVVIDSEDTDVYVQAAYVSQQLRGDLLIKRRHELINCYDMLSEEVASIIIPLHVITQRPHICILWAREKAGVVEDHQ